MARLSLTVTMETQRKLLYSSMGILPLPIAFETIFPQFTNKYRVVAPDLRGYGHSTNHTPITNADGFIEDLILFFDHLKLTKFALLGWSTGGGVAMKFAARHSDYVNKFYTVRFNWCPRLSLLSHR